MDDAQLQVLLEGVPEAELELALRSIGCAFAGHLSKRGAGWAHVRIIPVRVVEVVESLSLEDQLMILMTGDDVKALLQRGIETAEAGAINTVASTASGKRTGSRCPEDASCVDGRTATCSDFKILTCGAELMWQVGAAGFDVILVARTGPYSSLVKVPRDSVAGWTAGLRLDGSGELPATQQRALEKVRGMGCEGEIPDVVGHHDMTRVEVAGTEHDTVVEGVDNVGSV